MNWYKKAQYAKKKNQWSWEMFLKGISLGIFGSIALEFLAVSQWDKIRSVYEKNKNLFEQNPASAAQEVQQDFENLNITQQQQGQNVTISPKAVSPNVVAPKTIKKAPLVEKKNIPVNINLSKIHKIESLSGKDPGAFKINSKGALGHFQFLKGTWDQCVGAMGKNWEWEKGALDYNKSREVASYYFNRKIPSMLKEESIPDTLETRLAAYNWGIGHLSDSYKKYKDKWIKKAPSETKNYITKYKAAERIRNWFKKIGQQVIENPKDLIYEDIGHTQNPEKESLEEGRENYLWVYVPKEDRVYSVKEDNKNSSHDGSVLTNLLPHSSYLGRYDAMAKKLSISFNIRQQGSWEISAYKDVPEEVLSALRREFPDTQYVYFFGNNLS